MLNSSSTSAACPEHSQLLALVEGRLPDVEADTVSIHVADCDTCDARLELIEEQSDPFVEALACLPATDDDEATFQQLQAELLSRPQPFTGTGNLTQIASITEFDELTPLPIIGALPFRLGNYELLEQIGAGAHGAVFRARHCRLEREVAIKLLLRARGPYVDEFLNEMRVVGKLDHPNIIRATDAGERDGIYFLVMEFVPGLDVSSLLHRTGPLKVADTCEIIRQTALGLSFAHEHNLVHRDVKTSNLLFLSNGQIKLLDLGLATIPSTSQNGGTSRNRSASPPAKPLQSGPRGTADYMAPEQWRAASSVTHKADLYSLGCTWFKLLTGEPPFQQLPDGVSKQHAHEALEIPPLCQFRDDVPSSVELLLRSLLSKKQDQRPESALAVAEALKGRTFDADLPAIAREYCPELQTLPFPSDAPTDNLTGTLSGQIRRFADRVPKRTRIGGAILVLAAFAAFFATRPRDISTPVDTTNWRALSPAKPHIVLLADSDQSPSLTQKSADELQLQSKSLALLNLGNPLGRPFRWRTNLRHEADEDSNPDKQLGVFFRFRKAKTEFELQSLEVAQEPGVTRLLWFGYRESEMSDPVVLAESLHKLPPDEAFDLELVIGRTGYPEVALNGKSIPQTDWVFSSEAREFIASGAGRLSNMNAGRIGVLHHGGITTIKASELLYLD